MPEHRYFAIIIGIILGLLFIIGLRGQRFQIEQLKGPDDCFTPLEQWPVKDC